MLELTITSPYRIVVSKLSTLMPTNADECIPNESKKRTTNRQRESRRKREGGT
jgi:hypothetical protein